MTSDGHRTSEIAWLFPADGGSLGSHTLTTGEVLVPQSVEPYGPYVSWEYTDWATASSAGMLDALLRLRSASDVEAFIKRFGPVGFCMEHRRPIGHDPTPYPVFVDTPGVWQLHAGKQYERPADGEPIRGCFVSVTPDGRYCVEDPAMYLNLARQFRTGLDLAALLRQSDPLRPSWQQVGTEEQWQTFTLGAHGRPFSVASARPTPGDAISTDIYLARYHFEVALRVFALWSRVRPAVIWPKDDKEPRFVIEADNYGKLLLQFMLAVTGSQTLAVCAGCKQAYPRPGRRPQSGRRNYCPECRDAGIPARDAKRAQRSRGGPTRPSGGDPE